jgi:hypothetical protein
MNPLTVANAIANTIVAGAVMDMAIRVFGDKSHRIHQHPELFYIRKFISSIVICGAVLNIITLSTPNWTEVILNYGFAANYLFSSYYDRCTTSSKHSSASTKIPRICTACGDGNPAKTHKGSSAISIGRKQPASRQNKSV